MKSREFEFFVSLFSCISAISIVCVLRKSCSSVVLLLMPFMLNCSIFSVCLLCLLCCTGVVFPCVSEGAQSYVHCLVWCLCDVREVQLRCNHFWHWLHITGICLIAVLHPWQM